MGTIYKAYVIGFGFHRRALHVCVWRRDEREREGRNTQNWVAINVRFY